MSKTTIIIIVAIVIALGGAYFYLSGDSKQPAASNSLLQSTPTQSSGLIGAQVLTLLNQIRTLNIDSTVFKDKAYQSLVDYSVTIPPQNVGRTNPFAPIPGLKVSDTANMSAVGASTR